MKNLETDILIIGGGIAGCIAAISLVDKYNIILIDKLSEPNERIGESLAPAAQRILKNLDLLEGMQSSNSQNIYHNTIGMQSYWGSNKLHIVDHLRNPDGLSKSLDRKAFEIYLRKTVIKRGVQTIWPTKLYSSSFENQKWHVITKSPDRKEHNIKATFVIDATGRQSHFARSINSKRLHIDKLIACWATLPNKEENKMSTIAAVENGWWYSAVVPDNKRVLAFQTDSDLINRNDIKGLTSFLALSKKNEPIDTILKSNTATIEYHGTVSANSTRLKQVIGKQWAAIGDAAISFDPLSSQGMFNAMASAIQLKDLIVKLNIVQRNGYDSIKENQLQTAYTQQIDRIWNQYLYHKKLFYGAELRWKNHPFWKRRQ